MGTPAPSGAGFFFSAPGALQHERSEVLLRRTGAALRRDPGSAAHHSAALHAARAPGTNPPKMFQLQTGR
jgi:hypothetical protein